MIFEPVWVQLGLPSLQAFSHTSQQIPHGCIGTRWMSEDYVDLVMKKNVLIFLPLVADCLDPAQEAVTGMASSIKELDAAPNTATALASLTCRSILPSECGSQPPACVDKWVSSPATVRKSDS
jgi:hypothetical protein